MKLEQALKNGEAEYSGITIQSTSETIKYKLGYVMEKDYKDLKTETHRRFYKW